MRLVWLHPSMPRSIESQATSVAGVTSSDARATLNEPQKKKMKVPTVGAVVSQVWKKVRSVKGHPFVSFGCIYNFIKKMRRNTE